MKRLPLFLLALLLLAGCLPTTTPATTPAPAVQRGDFKIIDPSYTVAASEDDVVTTSAPAFSKTSISFYCGDSAGTKLASAARFSLPIPAGSTILTAKLTLVCHGSFSTTTLYTNLFFEAADNATQIADKADFDGRSLTDPVAWDSIEAWTAGTAYDSPDLTTILQAVIDRAGWASGNYVNVFWKDDGSDTNARRFGSSWDHTTYTEPTLTVTWSEPVSKHYGFVF